MGQKCSMPLMVFECECCKQVHRLDSGGKCGVPSLAVLEVIVTQAMLDSITLPELADMKAATAVAMMLEKYLKGGL